MNQTVSPNKTMVANQVFVSDSLDLVEYCCKKKRFRLIVVQCRCVSDSRLMALWAEQPSTQLLRLQVSAVLLTNCFVWDLNAWRCSLPPSTLLFFPRLFSWRREPQSLNAPCEVCPAARFTEPVLCLGAHWPWVFGLAETRACVWTCMCNYRWCVLKQGGQCHRGRRALNLWVTSFPVQPLCGGGWAPLPPTSLGWMQPFYSWTLVLSASFRNTAFMFRNFNCH